MALIQCPECGNNISEYADVCIHCGIIMKKIKEISFNKYASIVNQTLYGYECSDENAYIPDYITSIARMSRTNVKNVYLNDKIYEISKIAFDYQSINNIFVNEDNKVFSDIDGVLFNKDKTKIIKYPSGRKERVYIIPDSVKNIADGAFQHNKFLKILICPKNLEKLEATTMIYPGNIIGDSNCSDKKIIVISKNVKKLNLVYEFKKFCNIATASEQQEFDPFNRINTNFVFYEDIDFTDEKIDELINEVD